AGGAAAVAPEVDACEDELPMPLLHSAPRFRQHGGGGPAARRPAHERDHAEVAREATAVLDLHERPDTVEARIRLHASERPDVPGDERGRLLAAPRDNRDVLRQ